MDWLKESGWIYLRGVLIGVVLLALIVLFERILAAVLPLFEPFRDVNGKYTVYSLIVILLLPLLFGFIGERVLNRFKQQKGVRAFTRFDEDLVAELGGKRKSKHKVAIVPWPSDKVKSMALIMSTFTDPETGKELCATFIPNTPDPTGGILRVVAMEDLEIVDWAQRELTHFHITYGTANPG